MGAAVSPLEANAKNAANSAATVQRAGDAATNLTRTPIPRRTDDARFIGLLYVQRAIVQSFTPQKNDGGKCRRPVLCLGERG